METKPMSDQINELAAALTKAQGVMEAAKKDTNNTFFRSSYASLNAVIQAAKKPLADNGLSVVQTIEPDPEKAIVVTILLHSSGQWIRSVTALKPVKVDPQGMGSAITYARRYGYQAIVGLSADDDDGNAASQTNGVKGGVAKSEHYCELHQEEMKERANDVWDHRRKLNEKKEYDPQGDWYHCQGHGWHLSATQ